MRRCIPVACVAVLWSGLGSLALAEDAKDAQAILDKAIKALGGEEKLSTVKAATWKTKETVTYLGNVNEVAGRLTVQGLDHYRQESVGSFGKFGLVLNCDKGWRQFGDKNKELDEKDVAILKRAVYLQLIPLTVLPLKDKRFKVEVAGEEKVGDREAVGLKITPPDGKEFKLYFDKETGERKGDTSSLRQISWFDRTSEKMSVTFSWPVQEATRALEEATAELHAAQVESMSTVKPAPVVSSVAAAPAPKLRLAPPKSVGPGDELVQAIQAMVVQQNEAIASLAERSAALAARREDQQQRLAVHKEHTAIMLAEAAAQRAHGNSAVSHQPAAEQSVPSGSWMVVGLCALGTLQLIGFALPLWLHYRGLAFVQRHSQAQ